jgi:hypothetical protein
MFSRERSRFPVHRLPSEALQWVFLGAATLAICSAGPAARAQSAPVQPKAPPPTRTDNVQGSSPRRRDSGPLPLARRPELSGDARLDRRPDSYTKPLLEIEERIRCK